MKQHANHVAQQTFITMCHILKEQEGLYYREIAEAMDIETSIFCRWLHDSVCLPRAYNAKMAVYFGHSLFSKYKADLTERIIEALEISDSSTLAFLLRNMHYDDLIHYLFCELQTEDIEKENHIDGVFSDIVKNTIERKCMDYPWAYKVYRPEAKYLNMYFEENAANEDIRSNSKHMFLVEINHLNIEEHKMLICFGERDIIEKVYGCAMKCRKLLMLNPFGKVDHLIFMQIPEEKRVLEEVSQFERVGDFAARKILQVIKKIT